MRKTLARAAFVAYAVFILARIAPAATASGGVGFPETDDVRKTFSSLLSEPVRQIASTKSRVVSGTSGKVRIEVEREKDMVWILFGPERPNGFESRRQGDWRFARDATSGTVREIDIQTRAETGTFVRLYPFGTRTRMDIVLLGRTLNSGIVIPQRFENLFTAPFSRLVELSGDAVDWSVFAPDPALYENARRMTEIIRGRLPELRDADDGAMDANGDYAFIETLGKQPEGTGGYNCSGFAKWVVDGIYRPLTGRLTDIVRLKAKHLETRINAVNENLDPFFGLDWTRNLATEAYAALRPDRIEEITANDVRDVESFAYVENVGYPAVDLAPLLYLLAVRQPDRFYLASINGDDGSIPRMRRHFHVIVLVPYFDDNGDFRIAVFERNVESSVASIKARYPTMSAHLVGIDAPIRFDPPR